MTGVVKFRVEGVPQPQGSKTCFCKQVGGKMRGVIVEGRRGPARKAFKAWRAAVDAAAKQHRQIPGAVRISLAFTMVRPSSHLTRKGTLRKGYPEHPEGRPDIDKLARAVLDALTSAELIEDDSRVVELVARKEYGGIPGVSVEVSPVGPRQRTLSLADVRSHYGD
jgi:Holliday junction resolvase RusA-like endonuclease